MYKQENIRQPMIGTDKNLSWIPSMVLGTVSSVVGVPAEQRDVVSRAVSQYKSLESLLSIADNFTAFPTSRMLDILMDSIRHGGGGVAETFFGTWSGNAKWGGSDYAADRDELAVEIMSASLTKVSRCNFNHTTNGGEAVRKWKALVNGSKGAAMGRGLLTQVLMDDHGFQQYLNDKSRWLPELERMLENEHYIIGTIIKQLTEQSGLPAKMKVFMLDALGSSKVDQVLQRWRDVSGDPAVVQPAEYFVKNYNNLAFSVGKLDADPFVGSATAACNKSRTHTSYVNPTHFEWQTRKTETTFGASVASWLNSGSGPKRYGIRTGSSPNNVNSSSHSMSPFGCFTAGTMLHLKNGTQTSIEHIQEHDNIVGANGIIGTISSEEVFQVLENETPIFGFNEEAPFFSAAHPFWTQHGWCAVCPLSAKEENTWLEISQLTEGDFVKRLKSFKHGKPEYEWVEVKSIHFTDCPAGTKVYGVHTREGPRSYHANGYLVMQNYPEITVKRIHEGMQNISSTEQMKMHDNLKEIEPILHKVMGPGSATAISKLAEGYNKNMARAAAKRPMPKLPLRELSLPHINLNLQAGKKSHGSYVMPSKMSLVRGHLFLDDQHVSSTHITDDDKVSWTRPVADGKWEHGSVKLYPDRQQGHAFISLTHAREDSRSLVSASLDATSRVSTFTCYRSANSINEDSDKGISYNELGGLKIGLEKADKKLIRVGKIMLPGMEDDDGVAQYDDFHHHVVFSVDKKTYALSVNVVIPPGYQPFLKYTRFSGSFSWDFTSFSGFCVSYDETKPQMEGDHYAWKGIIDTASASNIDALHSTARAAALKSSVHSQMDSVHSVPFSKLMSLSSASVAPMMTVMASFADQHLSLEHLSTLSPPDSKSVHDLAFSLLQKAMKYEMNDIDRSDILGVTKPTDLGGDMEDVADRYKTFLGNKFANAYIMNGLSQNEHFADNETVEEDYRITDEQRNKLLYFWAGNEQGCLSHDKDYNNANEELARIAFIQSCPDIQKYMNSSEGGQHWAKQLFDKMMSPSMLNGFALAVDVASTTEIIQKQALVLYCLAPEEDYGSLFYKRITLTRLNETSSHFVGSKDDEKGMKKYFKDYIRQLVITIQAGGDDTTKDLIKELAKQLEEANKECNITNEQWLMAHDETTNAMIGQAVHFYFNATGPMMTRITKGMKTWMENHPKLTKVGSFFSSAFTMAAWSMALFTSIQTFMNWDNLTDEQRAQLVANTVSFGMNSIAKVPGLIRGIRKACVRGRANMRLVRNWITNSKSYSVVDGIESTIAGGAGAIEGEPVQIDIAMAKAASIATEDISATVTRWQRFFSVTEVFAKVTGVLALAAGCVAIGFQIARDFKYNADIGAKVIDVLQGVTIGVATIAAAVGLFVEAVAIPVIGIVCAVIGIVLSLVNLFTHREQPKPKPTRIQLFVKNEGKTFVNNLTAPTDDWLKEYHKKHPTKTID